MAAAAALPLEESSLLPNTRDLINYIEINNLFMLVIYQAGIPIQIPLFYDELAYEYLGLEGVALETHWRCPKPKLNTSDIARLFSEFGG